MAGAKKLKVKEVLQICVVVRDLEKAMKLYWDVFGIGPWHILTFEPPKLTNTKVRGKPENFSMKLAGARVGNINWELIQPLTGKSIYQEFLDQKGEGMQHVAFEVEGDYNQAVDTLKQHGIDILMSGDLPGESFAYMDTEKLGTIVELYNRPPGFKLPAPQAFYPPAP